MLNWLLRAVLTLVGLVALIAVVGYFVLRRADVPYETLAAQYESAASRYADLPGGVRMHYRDEGAPNGPPLVLIHGYAASLQTWEPWVQRLGDQYRVITLDLPGHGLTRAPAGYQASIAAFRDEVAAFAESQSLSHFALGGNSMGGHVAWEYGLAHPEQVDALILVDSGGWPPGDSQPENGAIVFRLLSNPTAAAIIRDLDKTYLVRQALTAAFPAHPELVDDAMVARYNELGRAPGHRDILMHLMLDPRSYTAATDERLAALHMPVLIMHGTDDRLIPFADAEKFHNAIAGSELAALEGIGHVPQEETPDESEAIVREFLSRAVGTPASEQAAH